MGLELRQRTGRFCRRIILWACLFRLCLMGVPAAVCRALADMGVSLYHTYSETGQDVRFSAHDRESPPPRSPEPEKPVFTREDAALVEMDYDCACRPDLEALLEQPLDWTLTGPEASVLILHTHTTESYTRENDDYTESSAYRTLNENYNMLSVGAEAARLLSAAGIGVLHDRQLHDYPSYNGSYVHARAAAEVLLEENPTICLVLDLHRDALEKEGKQLRMLAEDGQTAQLMLVVGTNVSHQSHENWQENLALALKLQVLLERNCPGIMRPLNLRAQRFNQDLSPGALLVEVGAAGNTHREALAAVRQLAAAIVALSSGTEK